MSKEKTQTAIETLKDAGLPSFLPSNVASDAGKGVSTAAEDNIVPLIRVLQPLSKALQKNNPEFISGAMAGDILLKNSAKPLVKGDEGFLFQPCYFHKAWVTRIPLAQGGGFVGQSEDLPKDAVGKPSDRNPNIIEYRMPNGNEVVETRYHSGFVHLADGSRLPYVIPMSSTGHTASKNWMFMMSNKMINGVRAPSFASLYLLKTRDRSNASGTWSTWDIQDAGWIQDEADYERGKALFDAFEKGAKKVEEDSVDDAAPASNDDTM